MLQEFSRPAAYIFLHSSSTQCPRCERLQAFVQDILVHRCVGPTKCRGLWGCGEENRGAQLRYLPLSGRLMDNPKPFLAGDWTDVGPGQPFGNRTFLFCLGTAPKTTSCGLAVLATVIAHVLEREKVSKGGGGSPGEKSAGEFSLLRKVAQQFHPSPVIWAYGTWSFRDVKGGKIIPGRTPPPLYFVFVHRIEERYNS